MVNIMSRLLLNQEEIVVQQLQLQTDRASGNKAS